MIDYDDFINRTVAGLPPSGIRKFFDLANEVPGTISLGVGEPDFVTPWDIRAAAIRSLQNGKTQYTSNAGLVELREEIAVYLRERFFLEYRPKTELLVTVGASEAIDLSLRAVVSPGDGVLVPTPSYVSYRPNITLVGGVPVPVPVRAETGFKLTPDELERAVTKNCKVLILPYPNNPTGGVMTKAELEAIVPVIMRHNLLVLSDEIYAELTYGGRHFSIAALPGMWERTVLLSGFSKAFAMTGWRIGYLAAPQPILNAVYRIHQYTVMCASTMSQYAALAALRYGREERYRTVEEMGASYDMRRKYLYHEFVDMGLACFEPKGAFYLFPSVESLRMTGQAFAQALLTEEKIAVVPGDAFGENGKYFIRCCYATSFKDLKTAAKRMRAFIGRRTGA
ncbi:MAG: aminotransferase class I/II-fold pyridoxal phosphate-dependent enzyme [Clostridiales bacterium]|jgi:aminotransferase|nr:aminotransferase class I/II-fold pyridoxal phosphate-dependent enzyme [Clostridiales bacterium]